MCFRFDVAVVVHVYGLDGHVNALACKMCVCMFLAVYMHTDLCPIAAYPVALSRKARYGQQKWLVALATH